MTVERASGAVAPRTSFGDIALDGLFAGMIGALVVAVWFLILDVAAGRPLYTPALLGNVLLHGGTVTGQQMVVAPLEIAAYTAFHFVAFVVVGVVLSWLMTLFERMPIVGFLLLVLFACLQVGFLVLDAVLGAQLMGRLNPWTVVVANVLAAASMTFFLWKRHPGIKQGLDHMWEQK